MNIAVVGTGYVGLVSAACFAELGHTVWGVDIDPKKIDMLKAGKSPIFEPGLEELLEQGLKSERLIFTTDLTEALPNVEVVFSAVATPPGEGHAADLSAVYKVAQTVAEHAEKSLVFVNKSTVPIGTGEECEKRIAETLEKRGKMDIKIPVVSNPEFLREGMAVSDTQNPERIVIGINGDSNAKEIMEELYGPLTETGRPILFMDRESAEVVKYASNAFLANKISFINMIAELCEKAGGDVQQVARGMGMDTRIGSKFLEAGIGYGGSCFPKDVKALMATAKEYDVPMPLIDATHSVNEHQHQRFTKRILEKLSPSSTLAVWGLSFKPKTDDMRDAPSLQIIPALIEAGHRIAAYDPAAMERAKALLEDTISYASNPHDALENADALIILTDWDEFQGADLNRVKEAMNGTLLFDGRNMYDTNEVTEAGLQHICIGKPPKD